MASKGAKILRKQAANYRKAIKYLDVWGEITLEKLLKAGRIAGKNDIRGKTVMDDTVAQIWEQSKGVLPSGGRPGGTEYARCAMRDALEEGISTFESLAEEMG